MKKWYYKVAVIQYPGTNCEYETARALESVGIPADIFRWNRPADELKKYHGFVIAGGFSYQDRIRAGAVAAKKSIIGALMAEAEAGKPVLGICNGAQVLIETGMVPGISWGETEMALAANLAGSNRGYHCDWVFLRAEDQVQKGCFNRCFSPGEVIPIPVAHAEGRFTTRNPDTLTSILKNHQIAFRYCTPDGKIDSDFPFNPNGSIENIAGVYNPSGNVLALMPHPERAAWIRQIPVDLPLKFSQPRRSAQANIAKQRLPGPGASFFKSMKSYLEEML
jgi:phosphoribosylformylglycinamidine synthase subunit PurQ / glutaminase